MALLNRRNPRGVALHQWEDDKGPYWALINQEDVTIFRDELSAWHAYYRQGFGSCPCRTDKPRCGYPTKA